MKIEKTVMISPVIKMSTREAIKKIALEEERPFDKQVQVALDYFIAKKGIDKNG